MAPAFLGITGTFNGTSQRAAIKLIMGEETVVVEAGTAIVIAQQLMETALYALAEETYVQLMGGEKLTMQEIGGHLDNWRRMRDRVLEAAVERAETGIIEPSEHKWQKFNPDGSIDDA